MKQLRLFSVLIITICFIAAISCRSKQEKEEAKEESKKYVQFARLPYCDTSGLKEGSCAVCELVSNDGYKVAHVESKDKNEITFRMVVSANNDGEIVISFGGPKSENITYLQQIYANGISQVPQLNNLKIENEFWNVYNSFFRESLTSKMSELNEKASKIVFVGHSFGGAMAMIAVYDLVYNNIIKKNSDIGPFLYTYGALKIGTQSFTSSVQEFIGSPLVRIRRTYDFFTWIPRCIFIPYLNYWHCYLEYPYLVQAYPMFASYYMRYSPIIRRALVGAIPSIAKIAKANVNKPVLSESQQKWKTPIIQKQTSADKQNSNKNTPTTKQNTPTNDSKKQQTPSSNAKTRYNELNSIIKDHKNGKHSEKAFINEVSNMFKNHKSNNIDKGKFSSSTPLKYSGLDNGKGQHLSSTKIKNSGLDSRQGNLSSMGLNIGKTQSSSTHNNLHMSNKMNNAPVMNFGTTQRTSNSISSSRGSSMRSSFSSSRRNFSRGRSFLETSTRIKSKRKNFINNCTPGDHYVSCKFVPSIHKEFFGIDIESCN